MDGVSTLSRWQRTRCGGRPQPSVCRSAACIAAACAAVRGKPSSSQPLWPWSVSSCRSTISVSRASSATISPSWPWQSRARAVAPAWRSNVGALSCLIKYASVSMRATMPWRERRQSPLARSQRTSPQHLGYTRRGCTLWECGGPVRMKRGATARPSTRRQISSSSRGAAIVPSTWRSRWWKTELT